MASTIQDVVLYSLPGQPGRVAGMGRQSMPKVRPHEFSPELQAVECIDRPRCCSAGNGRVPGPPARGSRPGQHRCLQPGRGQTGERRERRRGPERRLSRCRRPYRNRHAHLMMSGDRPEGRSLLSPFIAHFLIQGSAEPAGNAGEPALSGVTTRGARAVQPRLSLAPRLFRPLNLPQPVSRPVGAEGLTPRLAAAPAKGRAVPFPPGRSGSSPLSQVPAVAGLKPRSPGYSPCGAWTLRNLPPSPVPGREPAAAGTSLTANQAPRKPGLRLPSPAIPADRAAGGM